MIASGWLVRKVTSSGSPHEICAHKSNPKSRNVKTTNPKEATALALWLFNKHIVNQNFRPPIVLFESLR